MSRNGLRIQFAARFAVAFLLGTVALEVGTYLFLRRMADQRLTAAIRSDGADLARFLEWEVGEDPNLPVPQAVLEGLREFLPHNGEAAAYDSTSKLLAWTGSDAARAWMPDQLGQDQPVVADLPAGEHRLRVVTVDFPGRAIRRVVVAGSTRPADEENEALLAWLLASGPIVVITSVIAGYIFSRRATGPIRRLGNEISTLPLEDETARLPVATDPDEIGRLAQQFNALLDRLRSAEGMNRRFVQDAAHQIRTPLTLVLGEAQLALNGAGNDDDRLAALRRIRTAATQMRHRVDELFFLASAESDDLGRDWGQVDLEGLAFEATDLMRGRAAETGHRLELARVEAATTFGSEAFLREALIELVENACRHGLPSEPIRVSAYVANGWSSLEVSSGGAPLSQPGDAGGIGLRVVRSIARRHRGSLVVERADSNNIFAVRWPVDRNP